MGERRIPHFFQMPILLLAALMGIAGVGVGIWLLFASHAKPWLDAIPWALGSATITLAVADAIKHRHLSFEHLKVFALGIGALMAELVIVAAIALAAGALLASGC